jgi:hypothetical protein
MDPAMQERLERMAEKQEARRQQLLKDAAAPLPGEGFGPEQLGQVIADQVKAALGHSVTKSGNLGRATLDIAVPAGSDLTPLFNNQAGELVIRVRQYTPAPVIKEYEQVDFTPNFPVPEME